MAAADTPMLAPHPAKAGMIAFLISETAFFGTLVAVYFFFLRQTLASRPGPDEVFYLPLVLLSTACLLSSSLTMHMADRELRHGSPRRFLPWWAATIGLGVLFLLGTAREWTELIGTYGLTISTNTFGTCYFTLVGFHALHVTVGVTIMSIVLGLGLRRHITERNAVGVEVISWYWHFVDGVWFVVFTVVYLVGR
jgi:cytochrome c oxidase subunit 3/cytochrome o ubiquinol oxidase subunit 3